MLVSLYNALLNILFPKKGVEREVSLLSIEDMSKKLRLQEREGIVSLFTYKDSVIKQMIWLLKYKRDTHVVQLFALSLYDYLIEEFADEAIFSKRIRCVIIPLPLSKKRERERGFNQMKLVTDALQKLGDFSVATNILLRVRHTAPQTTLTNRKARIDNVKRVFEVKSDINLDNTHILLIDDVFTTGSTLKEAKKTLKEAGAYKVSCITLSH